MHEPIERFEQAGLLVDQRLVTPTLSTQPIRRLDPGDHLRFGLDHRIARHPRSGRHRGLATPTEHLRCRPHDHTTLHLIHVRQHHLEETREPLRCHLHNHNIHRAY